MQISRRLEWLANGQLNRFYILVTVCTQEMEFYFFFLLSFLLTFYCHSFAIFNFPAVCFKFASLIAGAL